MANEPIIGTVLNADQEALAKCKEEIDAALKKHGCAFDAGMLLRPGHHPEVFMKIVRQPKVIVPQMGFPQNPGGKPFGKV